MIFARLMRELALGLSLSAFFFSSTPTVARTSAPCGTDRPVRFGGLDWDSNTFHVEIARFIIEHGYGCKTDVVAGTSLPLISALGRGDIDILMEVWIENVNEAWKKLRQEGKVSHVGVNFADAVQGFYVPTYLIKGDQARGIEPLAPDLKHVDDLKRYWELFRDPEQPTKGRFYNCSLGWTCETVNTKKFYAYGLSENFVNFRPGTGAALAAAIASAHERGAPFVAYYWGPTWILGKYDLTMLDEPPFDPKIWEELGRDERPTRATAYPMVSVYIGVNNEFKESFPRLISLLREYETTSEIISNALAYVRAQPNRTIKDAARHFLETRDDIWTHWVSSEVEENVRLALDANPDRPVATAWTFKIDKPINRFVTWLVREYQDRFEQLASPVRGVIIGLESMLKKLPHWGLLLAFAALAVWTSRSVMLALIVALCLALIIGLGLWHLAVQTLALMLISTLISVVVGIPIGIALAYHTRLRSLTLPILDAMQTMPSFVYLIPALMLFGLGKVPAVFATVIYAVSPLIRLTDHGIRHVDRETLEAARAFGSRRRQLLTGVQLPLALPTIMAGINQTTMLALSMVVIASMIGARGLGEEVLLGIQKLDVGRGFTAGIAIVALAVVLDRITQSFGRRLDKSRA